MIGGIVSGLICAWFLAFFGFDDLVINCAKEVFNLSLTENTYYMMFVVLGILSELN